MAKVAEGLYKVRVKSWGIMKPEKAQHPIFQVNFDIIGTFDKDTEETTEVETRIERKITRSLSPKGLSWLKSDLALLGFTDTTKVGIHRIDPTHPEAHDFTGTEVVANCWHKEKDGKTWEEWRLWEKREAVPASEAEKEAAFAMLAGSLAD